MRADKLVYKLEDQIEHLQNLVRQIKDNVDKEKDISLELKLDSINGGEQKELLVLQFDYEAELVEDGGLLTMTFKTTYQEAY